MFEIVAGQSGEGILSAATLAWSEPPNCAPSLRSVAGLLLALALQSGYEDALALLPSKLLNCRGAKRRMSLLA